MSTTIEAHAADPLQYAAAMSGVAFIDRSEQGKLAVSGADATAYLDALLSNDIAAIPEGSGAEATLLTPKGRMLAQVRVLRTAEELLLDTERVALQALFDALTQFRIGYAAELHKRTLERALFSVVGPGEPLRQLPGSEEHAHVTTEVGGVPVRAIRTRLGVDLLCKSSAREAVGRALEGAGAMRLSEATMEVLRIEQGIPRYGVEIDETTMPQEAGIHERAVSYSKGCYIGQETVARLYWKGKPNRVLRGLALSEPAPPGTALLHGENEVGKISAVALSPRLGPIALALIRVEAEPGDTLSLADANGSATLVALPFL